MKAANTTHTTQQKTASEIRKLSSEQCNLILEAAAKRAEEDYRNNLDLTDFNAFGEDDLYDDQIEEVASAIALCVGSP